MLQCGFEKAENFIRAKSRLSLNFIFWTPHNASKFIFEPGVVMLAAMGLQVTVFDKSSPSTLMKTTLNQYILSGNTNLIIVAGHLTTPNNFLRSEAVATFGKIMPRPTMAAGSLTYGFLTKKREIAGKSNIILY